MVGIQRVPALIHNFPFTPLKELNLDKYEILPCEPLNDITGHIKIIFVEIPSHLLKAKKNIFNETLNAAFEGKDSKRGCDYRAALVKLSGAFRETIPEVHQILFSLCEIQQILYSKEVLRTNLNILRLHNITFQHVLYLTLYLNGTLNELTNRKMFGKVFSCYH